MMQLTTHQHAGLAHTCRRQRLSSRQTSLQSTCTPYGWQRQQIGGMRRSQVVVQAEGDGASQQDDEVARREEARIAALEKLTRTGPEQKKRQQSATQRAERREATAVVASKGKWREGELFPQGWEKMGVPEKAWQLWAGERGFLFWSNKLALSAIVVLAVAWVLFRFVGPALGLYTLTNDLLSPPNE